MNKIKLKYVYPFIQFHCFDKRRGIYSEEKVGIFIKIRVIFWPEISALGAVFLNFDNEYIRLHVGFVKDRIIYRTDLI